MKRLVTTIEVPRCSEIAHELAGSYFHDCHAVMAATDGKSAMELYMAVVSRTPRWVDALMTVRNRVVSLVGLKNLGSLRTVRSAGPAHACCVGDRVGIFSLLYVSDNEVVLGDSDKHLDVKVSVCKILHAEQSAIAVSTVVHVHNTLGRIYMFFVAPVHKVIVPAMLTRAPQAAAGA